MDIDDGATQPALGPVVVWLSLAAMAIIVAGIVGHVLKVREATYGGALEQARVSTDLLSENAGRLLDTADFLVDSARARVAGRTWDAIAADRSLWQGLKADADRFEHVDAVWLNDLAGNLRLVTHAFPAPVSNVLDRDFYRHFADGRDGPYISQPLVGRVTEEATFLLTRRLNGPDGKLRGIASVTLDPDFFADFLETFELPYGADMTLVREQGDVLVSDPPGGGAGAAAVAAAQARDVIGHGVLSGPISDERVIGWVKRLDEWPLFAVVRFDRAVIDDAWVDAVTPYAVIGSLALLSLLGLAGFAHAGERARRRG
ncbi:hypothetical protein [Caenispirillum bisanense]|uniref:PDC sensor domain-containing protein n=1 Tax=Caenispirillum bisanense TaxID=414052 RepID=UPI001143EF2C|nr:hypothetical protein [Caenispirillum bisanense]